MQRVGNEVSRKVSGNFSMTRVTSGCGAREIQVRGVRDRSVVEDRGRLHWPVRTLAVKRNPKGGKEAQKKRLAGQPKLTVEGWEGPNNQACQGLQCAYDGLSAVGARLSH
jgi:hypothetical protein